MFEGTRSENAPEPHEKPVVKSIGKGPRFIRKAKQAAKLLVVGATLMAGPQPQKQKDFETKGNVENTVDKTELSENNIGKMVYSNPSLVLQNAKYFLHLKNINEIVWNALAFSSFDKFVEHIDEIDSLPFGREIIKRFLLLSGKEIPRNIQVDNEILRNAAWDVSQKSAGLSFMYYSLYKNHPGAKNHLLKVSMLASNYDFIINFAISYSDIPEIKPFLLQSIKQNPKSFIANYSQFKNFEPRVKELENILNKNSVDPRTLIVNFDQYAEDLKDASSSLHKILENLLEDNSTTIFGSYNKFKNEPYALEIISKAAKVDTVGAVLYFTRYKELDGAKDVLIQSIKSLSASEPMAIMRNIPLVRDYLDRDFYKKSLKEAFVAVLKTEPHLLIDYTYDKDLKKYFTDKKTIERIVVGALEKDPASIVNNARFLKKYSIFKKIIKDVAQKEPFLVIEKYSDFKEIKGAQEILKISLERCLEINPEALLQMFQYYKDYSDKSYSLNLIERALKRSFYPEYELGDEFDKFVSQSMDPAVMSILLNKDQGINGAIFDEVYRGNMTIENAKKIDLRNPEYFIILNRISTRPGHLSDFLVNRELQYASLSFIFEINQMHNEPDEKRFASLKNLDAKSLYNLLIDGEDEVFTSSFNGIFNELLRKMNAQKTTGSTLLREVNNEGFRTFIKMLASYNRLDDFLNTMDQNSQITLVGSFVRNLDHSEGMVKEAVIVADAFESISNPQTLKTIQENIRSEYARVQKEGSQDAQKIYGLLAGMFGNRAVTDTAWLKEMSDQYELPELKGIKSAELFNKDAVNLQEYFFYNDKDGEASYRNFLSFYADENKWRITDYETYIRITSIDGNKKIEIFANKPNHEEGSEEIKKILDERKFETIIIVHRGHSYHVDQTISRIPSTARIISLGSCGGYNNLATVLEKAPQAHILSTKGTGTMLVNDPILSMLNTEILNGKDIVWPDLWEKIEKKLSQNPNFHNYVPPHKNLGFIFLKAYQKLGGKIIDNKAKTPTLPVYRIR